MWTDKERLLVSWCLAAVGVTVLLIHFERSTLFVCVGLALLGSLIRRNRFPYDDLWSLTQEKLPWWPPVALVYLVALLLVVLVAVSDRTIGNDIIGFLTEYRPTVMLVLIVLPFIPPVVIKERMLYEQACARVPQ